MNQIQENTELFALRTLLFASYFQNPSPSALCSLLLHPVASNYRAAKPGQTKAVFISRLIASEKNRFEILENLETLIH